MSKIKHAYRLMVIDIEEDKVVIDEFCDAIVAGVATNGGSLEKTEGKELLASKSDFIAGIAVVAAAEKSNYETETRICEIFYEKCEP